jgi:hypothetical protein
MSCKKYVHIHNPKLFLNSKNENSRGYHQMWRERVARDGVILGKQLYTARNLDSFVTYL